MKKRSFGKFNQSGELVQNCIAVDNRPYALEHYAHAGAGTLLRARLGARERAQSSAYAYAGAGESGKGLLGYGKIDYPLLAIALTLSLLGLLFIYSASSYGANLQFGDSYHYVKTQAVALVIGVFAMTLITFSDASKLQKFAPVFI